VISEEKKYVPVKNKWTDGLRNSYYDPIIEKPAKVGKETMLENIK